MSSANEIREQLVENRRQMLKHEARLRRTPTHDTVTRDYIAQSLIAPALAQEGVLFQQLDAHDLQGEFVSRKAMCRQA